MAIGVRITSDNLSGQTASVTFQSMTGGTPIDLGIQTIPFNYYNVLPYGEYTISSTTYDYVYTLNISQPYGENQSYIQMGNVSGETTYSLGILNFNNFTAEIINYNIDANYWSDNNYYPMSELGYMIQLSNYGDNAQLCLFINNEGVVVDQYSAITTNYSSDVIDGRITVFNDRINGILTYFNGESVYQYVYNPSTNVLDIQWDWDGTCLDGTFLFKTRNSGTTTDTLYKVSNNGSVSILSSWDYSVELKYCGTYYPTNYIYEITYLVSDNTMSSIKIYDTLGDVKFNQTVTPNTYPNWDYSWYGENSLSIVMYNAGNNNTDYLIYNFNLGTNVLLLTTHARGTNYTNFTIMSEQNYWPDNSPSGGLFIVFYGDVGNYFPGGGYEVGYLDIVYKLKNDTQLTTYVFNDTGVNDKTFSYWGWGVENFYTNCSTGDSISSIFSITENGVKITQTNDNLLDINNSFDSNFGDYYTHTNVTGGDNLLNSYLLLNGELVDTLNLNGSVSYDDRSDYETYFISNETTGYYVNNLVTGYTEIESYLSTYVSNSYYTQQYYLGNSNILLLNNSTFDCRVLTNNGISEQFNIPDSGNEFSISIGKNHFIYVYIDNGNQTRINLYNFNGALVNSTLVNINGWNNVFAVKDRYVVRQNNGNNQYLLTMISENEIKQITINDEYSAADIINDYIWWD